MKLMERLTVALEPLIYDETTGLPKLPDGYAWKVEVNYYNKYEKDPENTALTVRIAHREEVDELTWFGRLIGAEPTVEWNTSGHKYDLRFENCANDAGDVKSAATQLYNTFRNSELEHAKKQKLTGLYPPNSIL